MQSSAKDIEEQLSRTFLSKSKKKAMKIMYFVRDKETVDSLSGLHGKIVSKMTLE